MWVLKREAGACDWDSPIPGRVRDMLQETVDRVGVEDPVGGVWCVSREDKGTVWCDASSLALGVLLEVDGEVVEDASWLRKTQDVQHINVAELDAVLKGLNLALSWGLKIIEVRSDSATVCGWLASVIEDSHRPRTNGLSEMIVKRRLGIIGELLEEYRLQVTVVQVSSAENKSDALTRVSKKWLKPPVVAIGLAGGSADTPSDAAALIRETHVLHHLGVTGTQHFAELHCGVSVAADVVKKVVQTCEQCQRIDPAPVRWPKGHLDVAETWRRLSADIVHYRGVTYLSVVDCGPGRYAMWKRLLGERSNDVARALRTIFMERGAPGELLTDNGPCFRGPELAAELEIWGVAHLFSCAYRPSGNGIVERHHRTIKRMCARTGKVPEEVIIWYNNTPNQSGVSPAQTVFRYVGGLPHIGPKKCEATNHPATRFQIGDEVYVRPPDAKCTSVWPMRKVTNVISTVSVEVEGTPRHIRDLRLARRYLLDEESNELDLDDDSDAIELDLLFQPSGDQDEAPLVADVGVNEQLPRRSERVNIGVPPARLGVTE